MLSKASLNILRFAFKNSSFWNFCPYQWDSQTNRVRLATSKLKISLFALNVLLVLLYEVYLWCRVLQLSFSPNSTVAEVVKVTYNGVIYMLPLAFQYNVIRRWTEIPAFVNGYLTGFERFKGWFCKKIAVRLGWLH